MPKDCYANGERIKTALRALHHDTEAAGAVAAQAGEEAGSVKDDEHDVIRIVCQCGQTAVITNFFRCTGMKYYCRCGQSLLLDVGNQVPMMPNSEEIKLLPKP